MKSTDDSPDLETELVELLGSTVDETGGTACILRVGNPVAGVTHRLAVGGVARGGDPATPATPFRIASITKTFTAVVIAQLAAAGRLDVDARAIEYLPDDLHDLIRRLHVLDGVSYGESLTVRHLLTHSGGLFDYASSPGFYSAIASDPTRPWHPTELLQGAVEWGTPHFPPGRGYGYAYSDTGYVVLGLLIETLDDCPLNIAYRRRILDPLGMDATYLEGYEDHRGPPMAHTYQGEIDTTSIHGSADWAGGGLVSDVDDLARFADGLFGGRLLEPQQVADLLEYRFRALDPALHTPGYLGYGQGVDARLSNGVLWRGHRGHWGALFHVEPRSGTVITGTVNDAERRPDGLFHGVVAALLRHGIIEPGDDPPPPETPTEGS